MLREESRAAVSGVVDTMLKSIEQGDMERLRRCFAPGARVWHNNDEVEQDIDGVTALLGHVCAISTSRTYDDRRATTIGSMVFLQHTLAITLGTGRVVRIPTIMRVEVDADGLVARIEEYFDSRAVERIFEEAA